MTTIVQLLMTRDGLDESEAREREWDIYSRVAAGESLLTILPEFDIDPRELGLLPVDPVSLGL